MVNILVNMFIYELHDAKKLLHSVTHVILKVVQHDSKRHYIIDIHFLSLVISLQVDEKVVLGSQLTVALNMVHQLLQAVLAYHVVLDATRCWLPLEVVKRVIVIVGGLPSRGQHCILILWIVSGL